MNLKDFEYTLPETLIAQHPRRRRDQARLMVIDKKRGRITHDVFCNLDRYLPDSSTLVVNDSKVIPARLLGRRSSGAEVEIFLLRKLSDGYSYEALLRPLKRLKVTERIVFNGGKLTATIVDKERRIVRFNTRTVMPHLKRIGHMPLPPYIKRGDRAEDRKYYQTVFARKEGSVAAPTAGLHFTSSLLKKIQTAGHGIIPVTLHINYATFKPVEVADITAHKMHFEDYSISPLVYKTLTAKKRQGLPVVAVGTTSCRVLESVARGNPLKGSTDIFIYPGYKFRMTDILITNFHLPQSTLLMLVCAFGGQKLISRAYREAVEKKYRFFSYGDAMMII